MNPLLALIVCGGVVFGLATVVDPASAKRAGRFLIALSRANQAARAAYAECYEFWAEQDRGKEAH